MIITLNKEFLIAKYNTSLTNLNEFELSDSKINKIDSNAFKDLNRLEKLVLNNNHLTELDGQFFDCLPTKLSYLNLSRNKLKKFTINTNRQEIGLERLDLSYNQLERIDFEHFNNLNCLYLNGNKLKAIEPNTFRGLNQLQSLYLSNNQIEEIHSNVFEGLSNLRELRLNNNRLVNIDENLFKGLNNLVSLYLNSNQLTILHHNTFSSLSSLKELSLFNNKLETIESCVFEQLTRLEKLYLNNNDLSALDPKLFTNLSNLQELSLYNNKLKIIDSSLFNGLTKLEKLALNSNQLKVIVSNLFERLSNLVELDLYNIKLENIEPNSFKGLLSLEKLNLSNNQLTEIDGLLFQCLSNLKELSIYNNKLKVIELNSFNGLDRLEILNLNNNQITKLDGNIFQDLSSLKVLNLCYNELKEIEVKTFKQLANLEVLYLNNNKVTSINVELFQTLVKLNVLKLNDNELKQIDRETFEHLKSIGVIQLYGNDLNKVLSYLKLSAVKSFLNHDTHQLNENHFFSDWNQFMEQFPKTPILNESIDVDETDQTLEYAMEKSMKHEDIKYYSSNTESTKEITTLNLCSSSDITIVLDSNKHLEAEINRITKIYHKVDMHSEIFNAIIALHALTIQDSSGKLNSTKAISIFSGIEETIKNYFMKTSLFTCYILNSLEFHKIAIEMAKKDKMDVSIRMLKRCAELAKKMDKDCKDLIIEESMSLAQTQYKSKPYVCTSCQKRFARRDMLDHHSRLHLDVFYKITHSPTYFGSRSEIQGKMARDSDFDDLNVLMETDSVLEKTRYTSCLPPIVRNSNNEEFENLETRFKHLGMFLLDFKKHCIALTDLSQFRNMNSPDLKSEFINKINISGVSWLSLAKINYNAQTSLQAAINEISKIDR